MKTLHPSLAVVTLLLCAPLAPHSSAAGPGLREAAIAQGASAIAADSLQSAAVKVVSEKQKLVAADGDLLDNFGASVSVSGNLAIVGTPNDSDIATDAGSAYVFAFDGMTWIQQAKLTASDEKGLDNFGISVAISGNLALVGASGDDTKGSNSGAVYVFAFDGTIWTQQAKLIASRWGSGRFLRACRRALGNDCADWGGGGE